MVCLDAYLTQHHNSKRVRKIDPHTHNFKAEESLEPWPARYLVSIVLLSCLIIFACIYSQLVINSMPQPQFFTYQSFGRTLSGYFVSLSLALSLSAYTTSLFHTPKILFLTPSLLSLLHTPGVSSAGSAHPAGLSQGPHC